ncbi:MAG: biotin/lipoyl-binding protein, partial [Tepidimonas sp.]|uniref:biotin/lipoyl-binding protein n=1 Tax=Tepidimonas sp. TaxID=2002775 RepID=UPI00259FA3EA
MLNPTMLGRAALAALILAALPWSWTAPAAEPNTTAPSAAIPPTSAPVRVQPLSQVALRPERQASAQVVARNEARIAAEVGGVLLRWSADVGQPVRAGQPLAWLDAADLELARDRARAARDAA